MNATMLNGKRNWTFVFEKEISNALVADLSFYIKKNTDGERLHQARGRNPS